MWRIRGKNRETRALVLPGSDVDRRDFFSTVRAGALTALGAFLAGGAAKTAKADTSGDFAGTGAATIVPVASSLPGGERFGQSPNMAITSDLLPKINEALKKYGHLA